MSGEIPVNPITEVKTKTKTALIIEQTPRDPITITQVHTIAELKKAINKYNDVIAIWQAKIDPMQAIIDEYDSMELTPVPEPEPEEPV